MPVIFPSAWNELGMTWSDPDPLQAVYWRALFLAARERYSVVWQGYGGAFSDDVSMRLLLSDSFFSHPNSYYGVVVKIDAAINALFAEKVWVVSFNDPNLLIYNPDNYLNFIENANIKTVNSLFQPYLLPWIYPGSMTGDFSMTVAKKYLLQRKALLDLLLYRKILFPVGYPENYSKFYGKQGGNNTSEQSVLDTEKAESEADYDLDQPFSAGSLLVASSVINCYSQPYPYYNVGQQKVVGKIGISIPFDFAYRLNAWAEFSTPDNESDEGDMSTGGRRVQFDASFFPGDLSISEPGTYKIVSNRAGGGGSGFEWIDFCDGTLSQRPPWYSGAVVAPNSGSNYYIRGCQVNSGYAILNFNIDGGFKFRPT